MKSPALIAPTSALIARVLRCVVGCQPALPCPALPSLQGVMLEVFGAHNNARDFRNWKFARAISADELAQLQANRAKANPPVRPHVRQMECVLHAACCMATCCVLHVACCMLHVAADGRHDRGGARPETSAPGLSSVAQWPPPPCLALGPQAYPRRAAELRCAALRGVSASLVAARPRRLPQCVGSLNTAAHVYGPRGVACG